MNSTETLPLCANCHAQLTGKYCHQCGEKVLEPREKSFRYFLGRLLDALTFADVKGLNSFWILIRRPGLISQSYNQGIRKRFYLPLNLFLLTNLLYFLVPVFSTFNTNYKAQLGMQNYSRYTRTWVLQKQQSSGLDEKAYELAYNQKSNSFAKLLMLAFVGIFACFLAILYYRRQYYFTDYLSLSLEYNSFLVFYGTVVLALLSWLLYAITGYATNDGELTFFIGLATTLWMYAAGRRHFGLGKIKAILLGMACMLALAFTLMIYRLLLLYVTVLSL
jgi:hypothetical protein